MSKDKFTKTIELVTELYTENEALRQQLGRVEPSEVNTPVSNKDNVEMMVLRKLAKSYVTKAWFGNWSFPEVTYDGKEFSKSEEDIIEHIHERYDYEFLTDDIANVEVYKVIDPIISEAYKEMCEVIKEEWEDEQHGVDA